VERMRPATLKRFVRLPRFEQHLALHRLDCLSSHRNLQAYQFVCNFIRETPAEIVRPPKLVTGTDILDLDYAPGPVIGKILAAVEEAQLNGELGSKDEAISFVKNKFQRSEAGYKKSSGTDDEPIGY